MVTILCADYRYSAKGTQYYYESLIVEGTSRLPEVARRSHIPDSDSTLNARLISRHLPAHKRDSAPKCAPKPQNVRKATRPGIPQTTEPTQR